MIHFLIDYENKNEYGLPGIRSLSMEDHVYILFSQNACKLDLNVISDTACGIHAIKVQPGRQSLDMHLVSCLGFLLNQYGTENDYYVISDDTDFDRVIEFWKERGYRVSRAKSIEAALSPETADETGALGAAAPAKKKRAASRRTSASKGKKTTEAKTAVNMAEEAVNAAAVVNEAVNAAAVMNEAVNAAAVTNEAVNAAAAAKAELPAIKHTETSITEISAETADVPVSKDKAQVTLASAADAVSAPVEEVKENGAETASDNDEAAGKKEEKAGASAKDAEETGTEVAAPAAKTKRRKAPAKAKTKAEDESSQMKQSAAQKAKAQPESVAINSHIQKFLAQNKVNGTVINAIASIVAGNAGKKDRKALIYRQIIKKFGQKEGLEYYNLLKPEL